MDLYHCKPKVQSVLIWSDNDELLAFAVTHLKVEFEEYIFPFTMECIPTIVSDHATEDLEIELEKYDFHVIKVYEQEAVLLLHNNVSHTSIHTNQDHLEAVLEDFGRKIVEFVRLEDAPKHLH